MVSARRGWGTQRANPRAPAAQHLCPSTLRGTCTQWATTGAPDAFCAATSACRGPGTQGANPGAHAAQRLCPSTLRGTCTQWATTGTPDRVVVLGSAHPSFVGGSFSCLDHHSFPRAGAPVVARWVLDPLGTDEQRCCATRAPGLAPWVPDRLHSLVAPRTRKRHQREHWPTERSDPMQHAKGRAGDCPGPRKETTTRRNVTQGGGGGRWAGEGNSDVNKKHGLFRPEGYGLQLFFRWVSNLKVLCEWPDRKRKTCNCLYRRDLLRTCRRCCGFSSLGWGLVVESV